MPPAIALQSAATNRCRAFMTASNKSACSESPSERNISSAVTPYIIVADRKIGARFRQSLQVGAACAFHQEGKTAAIWRIRFRSGLHEGLCDLRGMTREKEWRFPIARSCIDVCSCRQQQPDKECRLCIPQSWLQGRHQGGLAILIFRIDGRMLSQYRLHRLCVA